MTTPNCPCCTAGEFEPFLDFGPMPVSGLLRRDSTDPVASLPLSFELCGSCGLVRQQKNSGGRDYSDTERPTAGQFPVYGDAIIRTLSSFGVGHDELILEIGSNDGAFLERLYAAGFRRLLGVEPSRHLAESGRRRGYTIVNDYFGPQTAAALMASHGPARVVVCRHTLEHVPDPYGFLTAMRDCLDTRSGIALVEVPDSAVIPERLNLYELWDEHLFYFSASNVKPILERAGMELLSFEQLPHLETRNLLAWSGVARLGDATKCPALNLDIVSLWKTLPARLLAYRIRMKQQLAAAARPLYLIGASHPQCNFANYLRMGALIDYLIDDDPAKVGRFPAIAGSRASVISTAEFDATARQGTVLKTGFGYPNWTARIIATAARHRMETLDPLEFIPERA